MIVSSLPYEFSSSPRSGSATRSAARSDMMSRHESLALGDPLDLDRHGVDRLFDALEPRGRIGWH